ncbi:MAG: MBL fold metallo-hydrolase [Flavobacterium sp.]|nr:MAG: MBL fold metallo-hydrolase [Flavobacterium sp.]
MTITFKDVGQGDSIIIEWKSNNIPKVGIIDCKKKQKSNPIIEHLVEKKYSEIEFLILSHPHSDHYSGFEELLDFIEAKNIVVHRFGNTLKEIGSGYWEWFEVSLSDTRQLAEIVRKAERLSTELGLIKKHFYVFEDWNIPLSEAIEIRSLSPSHAEIKRYQKEVKYDAMLHKKQASKAANYLSSLFYIRYGDKNILLTSDVEKETFERIYYEKRFQEIRFCLCQAPHHGSYNNYHSEFWDALVTEEKKDVVFSSGLNEQYKHPHLITVKNFADKGYGIHPTNIVYGMQDYLDELGKRVIALDMISEVDEETIVGGDKTFSF